MRAIKPLLMFFLLLTGFSAMATVEPESNPAPAIGTENLFGKVFKEDSRRPLQNVTVTAILLNKKEKFTFTDTDGEFGIEELKPGTYKIIFEKDGYRKVVRDKVNIRTNEPIELNIEMEYLEYNLFPSPFHFFLVD